MMLTYQEAQDTILKHTAIAYTRRSLDRLWTAFVFDEDGERLYFTTDADTLSYDRDGDVLVWTTRNEAEDFAAKRRLGGGLGASVYVINQGDDSRAEDAWLELRTYLTAGRFVGSQKALVALAEARRLRSGETE